MKRSLLNLSIVTTLVLSACKTGQSTEGQKIEGGKATPTEIKGGGGTTNKDSLYKVNPQPMKEAPRPGRPN